LQIRTSRCEHPEQQGAKKEIVIGHWEKQQSQTKTNEGEVLLNGNSQGKLLQAAAHYIYSQKCVT
jgi:hypothetical protein